MHRGRRLVVLPRDRLDGGRDLPRRGALFLDRGGDGGGHLVHAADRRADLLHGADRVERRGLDRRDLLADLFRRARRLGGERLHLGGDHREALAGIARARRLDRGVEREQVGLRRDAADQPHHVADLAGGFRQPLHARARRLRTVDRFARGGGGGGDLAGDLADADRQLLRRRRDGGEVARAFLGARGGALRLVARALGGLRHVTGGIAHPAGRFAELVHDARDGTAEFLRVPLDGRLAAGAGGLLGLGPGVHARLLLDAQAEGLERAGHAADFVGAIEARHGDIGPPAGDRAHRLAEGRERPGEPPRRQHGDRQGNQDHEAAGGEDGPEDAAFLRIEARRRHGEEQVADGLVRQVADDPRADHVVAAAWQDAGHAFNRRAAADRLLRRGGQRLGGQAVEARGDQPAGAEQRGDAARGLAEFGRERRVQAAAHADRADDTVAGAAQRQHGTDRDGARGRRDLVADGRPAGEGGGDVGLPRLVITGPLRVVGAQQDAPGGIRRLDHRHRRIGGAQRGEGGHQDVP